MSMVQTMFYAVKSERKIKIPPGFKSRSFHLGNFTGFFTNSTLESVQLCFITPLDSMVRRELVLLLRRQKESPFARSAATNFP